MARHRAPGNYLALAVDFSCCRDGEYAEGLVETRRRYQFYRDDALPAVCTPWRPPKTKCSRRQPTLASSPD